MTSQRTDSDQPSGLSVDEQDKAIHADRAGQLSDEQISRRNSLNRLGKFSVYAIPAVLALSSKSVAASPV